MLPANRLSLRASLLLVAVAASLSLGACSGQSTGGGSFEGTKQDVADVIKRLGDLAQDRDSSTICAKVFAPQLAAEFARLGGGQCSRAVDRAVRGSDYTRLVVDSIELNGSDATALQAEARTFVQTDGPRRGVTLVRADPKSPWQISALQASVASTTPATPASPSPAASPAATSPQS